jgi:hypothetical protein
MRKTYSYYLLAILVGGLLYAGCKEKPVTTPGDLENPKIFMTSPVTVPMDGEYPTIYSSDSFDIDIRFEDDIALKSYEIQIRFKPDLSYLRVANDPWNESFFGNLEGKSDAINFRVYTVYNPTAGPYEFLLKVWDEDGNLTETKTYLHMLNRADTLGPRIRYINPDTINVDTAVIGQNLGIQALINEIGTNVIKDVYLRVRDNVTNEILPGSEIRYDTLYVSTFVLDTNVAIPAGTVPGNYRVELYANDPVNNVNRKDCVFYIKPN